MDYIIAVLILGAIGFLFWKVLKSPANSGAIDNMAEKDNRITTEHQNGSISSFPAKNLTALILYMQNVSSPPGGGEITFNVFSSLNKPDMHVLKAANIDAHTEARNLRIDDYKAFASEATQLASNELQSRFSGCAVVIQPNSLMVPGTGQRSVILCSFFSATEPAVIVLQPMEPYKLY